MADVAKEVFGRDYFAVDPTKCVLLIVDMQNSFIAEDGVFRVPKGAQIIPKIEYLISYFRSEKLPIIWTQADHSPPAGGLILERYPIIKETKELWKGDKSFELFEGIMPPLANEIILIKHKYDAFHDTELDTILKNLNKDTLVITGVTTEVCCESTARGAFSHEYKVVFLRDATAATEPEFQDITCDRIELLFARVINTDELIDLLKEGGDI